ncbi:MAG: pyridoxine 5'-phosphate synthase, partial [Bacteroidota bacterium]
MTNLSVNINKVALIRNSRGANYPNLVQFAKDCERFGAEGITIHPRPDERHARYSDVPALKEVVKTELNVEGNPIPKFLKMVLANQPHQCTLVPDAPDALTSDSGWDTIKHKTFLTETIAELKAAGIRTSIFIDPVEKMIEGAKAVGTDRIEFYTGPYAHDFGKGRKKAVEPYARCGKLAHELGLGINAGHDLNTKNLHYFLKSVGNVAEVSIGHALVTDALYYGLHHTILMYLHAC